MDSLRCTVGSSCLVLFRPSPAAGLKDLTLTLGSIGQSQGDDLVELGELDIVEDDEGAVDGRAGMGRGIARLEDE